MSTLTFQDFLIESGGEQCDWCGRVGAESAYRTIQADEPGQVILVCQECWEQVEWESDPTA